MGVAFVKGDPRATGAICRRPSGCGWAGKGVPLSVRPVPHRPRRRAARLRALPGSCTRVPSGGRRSGAPAGGLRGGRRRVSGVRPPRPKAPRFGRRAAGVCEPRRLRVGGGPCGASSGEVGGAIAARGTAAGDGRGARAAGARRRVAGAAAGQVRGRAPYLVRDSPVRRKHPQHLVSACALHRIRVRRVHGIGRHHAADRVRAFPCRGRDHATRRG